ncbi:DUF2218 domain-containing protein [Shinella sp. BYT-45]|uniref:DUF2218 domain-containing protein n=1 Tax=Shinella sp. BYT-45 TaxID=3377377 RepID=UPI00397FD34F
MSGFVAEARIALPDPEALIGPVCEHLKEHGAEITREDGAYVVAMDMATSRFWRENDALVVRAEARDLQSLYLVKMGIASHLMEFAGDETVEISWTGDGRELAAPPNFQIMDVAAVRNVTPHMRRITLRGENLARFDTLEALHLRVIIQHPDSRVPQWPSVGSNGLVRWPEGSHRPHLRKYTVRSVDAAAGTMDIDFVIHPDAGPGSAWAERVTAGEQAGIVGPGGGGLRPADWYLFAGDETALPAIGRMLEALPETARGVALIEVADKAEEQAIATGSGVEIRWLHRNGAAPGSTTLLADAVREVAFPVDGASVFAWAGCEFDAFKAIRGYLRRERGLKKDENLIVSYWRKGRTEDELSHADELEH